MNKERLVRNILAVSLAGAGFVFPRAGQALAVPFVENRGQWDRSVAYCSFLDMGAVFVTAGGQIVYSMKDSSILFEEVFEGAGAADVSGGSGAQARVNFYKGPDPSGWHEDLPTYDSVRLGGLYDHIDIWLKAKDGSVEKVFLVHPGGDVKDIRVKVGRVRSVTRISTGELVVRGPGGEVRFTRPVAYQGQGEKRKMVEVAYRVHGSEYGFEVGNYDQSLPLVIDPLLASSFLGGSRNESAYVVADSGRDIVVAGTVESPDFPGLDDGVNPLGDAFVALMDRDLRAVRAVSYFGGSMSDGVRDIALGPGSIFAVGFNISPNFPTTEGAVIKSRIVSGAFIARLDSSTLRLAASTPFYGNVFAVAAAPDGGVFVAGSTGDYNFPTSGRDTEEETDDAYQAALQGGADGFVVKLDRDLTTLEASTFIGGEGVDIVSDLAVDGAGKPVVVGVTNSAGFPTHESAYDDSYNLEWEGRHQWVDGFIVRLTRDLRGLDASTYLGGGSNDYIRSVALDGDTVIVAGDTASVDFPCGTTFGPVDGSDAFVVRLDRYLSKSLSCVLYGGGGSGRGSVDTASAMVVHPQGGIYVTGRTDADDYPTTPGAFLQEPFAAYTGGYITAFTPDLSHMVASTLIHGSNEHPKALAIDWLGDVIVAGDVQIKGYPVTPGALQPSPGGGDDIFISRFSPDLTGPHLEVGDTVIDFGDVALGQVARRAVTLHNTGGSVLAVLQWSLSQPAGEFSMKGGCSFIPPFDSCPLEITFSPEYTGRREVVASIVSDDPFRPLRKVAVTGRGFRRPPAVPSTARPTVVDPDPTEKPVEEPVEEPSSPRDGNTGEEGHPWLAVLVLVAGIGLLITFLRHLPGKK